MAPCICGRSRPQPSSAYVRRRTEMRPHRAYSRDGANFALRHSRARDLAGAPSRGIRVLHNALVFLVAALVAAVFGFTGIAGTPMGIARIICVIFMVLCGVSLSLLRSGSR